MKIKNLSSKSIVIIAILKERKQFKKTVLMDKINQLMLSFKGIKFKEQNKIYF
jgi:hypothetical protein